MAAWRETIYRDADGLPIHGTEARYKRGCKCDYCMRASAARRRIRRRLATWRRPVQRSVETVDEPTGDEAA